jgi:hypothetical protein
LTLRDSFALAVRIIPFFFASRAPAGLSTEGRKSRRGRREICPIEIIHRQR